ncbi:uncharacterized protein LOC130112364 [Lampris incognitus]|uniref:uncharacterized protein LOC130112364 n=1 Tax=Lampris incognitus TaxID=2546036 RepID=UPI0024B4B16D|nr:uncharacterized protein LOC130112364 [Lampris incognitus]
MGPSGGTVLQLILLPILLQVYLSPSLQANKCSDTSSNESLICVNDYNNNITCVWNSTCHYTPCSLHAFRRPKKSRRGRLWTSAFHNTSCDLEPFDSFKPDLRRCSLVFSHSYVFQTTTKQEIQLTCKSLNYSLSLTYEPVGHIKLKPPGRPDINSSTISWFLEDKGRITQYSFQVQWKQEAQSWKDAFQRDKADKQCNPVCEIVLDPNFLERGKRYKVRIRVQPDENWTTSIWSDWSPTATWVSAVGKGPDNPGTFGWERLLGFIISAAVVLFLAVVLCNRDKKIWVCTLKRFTGPPLPNPGKLLLHDGNLQVWLTPQFTNDSYVLTPVDICSVEVTNTVESIVAQGSEAALPGKRNWDSCSRSTSSSVSNPIRPPFCPPPLSICTKGNLQPCAADSPYRFIGSQSGGAKDRAEEHDVDMENLKLLSCIGMREESVQESWDGDRDEKLQPQQCELQSHDSGMGCSEVEQVSEASMEEMDETNSPNGHSKQLQEQDGKKEKGKETEISQIFGGIFSQGSIQVCSDYEQIEKMRAPYPVLQSADSGISNQCKEQKLKLPLS